MNGLFRSARRTLSLGLVAALCLVGAVVAKGIHPETLVAFKSLNPGDSETLIASDTAEPQPPEHFAQADTETRLDVSSGIRSALNGRTSPSVNARRSMPDLSEMPSAIEVQSPEAGDRLPPLPTTPEEVTAESSPSEEPSTETATDVPPPAEPGPVFELPAPPESQPATEIETAPPTEVAVATPAPDAQATAEPAAPTATVVPMTPHAQAAAAPAQPNFAAQLAAMQEQLNKIAAQQEQSVQSQQSWLESNQLLQQRELQKKLDAIEASLKLMQTQSEQTATQPRTSGRTASRSSIIRHDKAGASRLPMMNGVTSAVRNALDSLGDQSNVNLTLSINVEGDVEMNLKDDAQPTASGDALGQPGYYEVQKNGRKFYVAPTTPRGHQRDEFLPPIVRQPQEGTQHR